MGAGCSSQDQRCPDEWRRWGWWQEAKSGEEEQWTRGTMERRMRTERRERERGGWRESEEQRRKVRYAKLRERADASGRLGRNEPCEKEELYLRPTMCKVAVRVLAGCDAMRCRCYGTPRRGSIEQGFSLLLPSIAKKVYEILVCPVFRFSKLSRELIPSFKKN